MRSRAERVGGGWVWGMVLWVLLWGCGEAPPVEREGAKGWQGVPLGDAWPDCYECHDKKKLQTPPKGASGTARDWLRQQGQGLVLVVPMLREGFDRYVMAWVSRAYHPPAVMARSQACRDCHGMWGNGTRHLQVGYPPQALAVKAGKDCATGCHNWLLLNPVQFAGFPSNKGQAPSYQLSLQPGALLRTDTSRHGQIFRQGYTRPEKDKERIRVAWLEPGCLGCHRQGSPQHGWVPSCLDCHRFFRQKDPLHANHEQLIEQTRAIVDPLRASVENCIYCHGSPAISPPLHQGVCYNCHLSAHQPLNAKGQPHFWPQKSP